MFIVPISELSSLSELQKASGEAAQQASTSGSTLPFSDVLQDAVNSVQETQEISKQDAYDLAMGRSDDLHSIMIHSAQASAAVKLTVELTSRVVSAYKEIMQMQV